MHQQNIERSLLTRGFADLGIQLKPIYIRVPRFVKRTGKTIVSVAAVLAPQDIFHSMHAHHQFGKCFGHPLQWEKFWHLMREETWFTQHCLAEQIRSCPAAHCPVLLHQDDAPVSRRVGRNFRAINMISPFAAGDAHLMAVLSQQAFISMAPLSQLLPRRPPKVKPPPSPLPKVFNKPSSLTRYPACAVYTKFKFRFTDENYGA